ncbi:hypothetical protein PVAND_011252 [Polypedilum vanderplanki]|uniref:Lipocalin/cytosolic fatty-acid binding domain-containing protein n=1 Tax=Polypedilum vanderplanki TaxID=319348 RepID=A0A9J6CIJ5_POLVA|nr:hypothetical protein PVAND_011252 [Polypedilum vanderplanki]
MKIFIAILAVICFSQAQEFFDRPCRTPEELGVKTGFLPNFYTGIWFEIERYEQRFQVDADCVRAEYTFNADGSIRVGNSAFRISTEESLEDVGRAVLSFPDEIPLRAMLNVTFGGDLINRSNYWVLSTDYSDYAFVVSCINLPASRSSESYWLLSRSTTISTAARNRANDLIEKFIDRSRIRVTNQDNTACRRI